MLIRKDLFKIREVKRVREGNRDTIEKRIFIVNVLFVLGPSVLSR